jgi:hypothetical protein
MLREVVPLFLLAIANACVSSGYERASATAKKTAAYRDDLVHLDEQVGLTTEALRALSENPGDSPRSNHETFETFTRELANLEAGAAHSRKTWGKVDGRAETFFGSWSEDAAQITDADLKQSAEARRTALQASFRRVAEGQASTDQAVGNFVRSLTDLRLYLEHDLTAAGIASARGSIQKALAEGVALREQLHQQTRATDEAREALAPLKDMAAAQRIQPYSRLQ